MVWALNDPPKLICHVTKKSKNLEEKSQKILVKEAILKKYQYSIL